MRFPNHDNDDAVSCRPLPGLRNQLPAGLRAGAVRRLLQQLRHPGRAAHRGRVRRRPLRPAAGLVLLEEEEQEGRTQHQERRGEGDPWRPAARSAPGPGLLVKETHAMD
ncbi:hypothetical protein VPH35_134716 [Triticum aestivum]